MSPFFMTKPYPRPLQKKSFLSCRFFYVKDLKKYKKNAIIKT